jgi:hypothetical protein
LQPGETTEQPLIALMVAWHHSIEVSLPMGGIPLDLPHGCARYCRHAAPWPVRAQPAFSNTLPACEEAGTLVGRACACDATTAKHVRAVYEADAGAMVLYELLDLINDGKAAGLHSLKPIESFG